MLEGDQRSRRTFQVARRTGEEKGAAASSGEQEKPGESMHRYHADARPSV